MARVLFLSGGESSFYESRRRAYNGVASENIFRSNSILLRVIRRILAALHFRLVGLLFGSWRRDLSKYDLVILPVSVYSRSIGAYIRSISDVFIVHWYWNPVSTTVTPNRLHFSRSTIFSFDEDDCRRYGLRFSRTYYFGSVRLPTNAVCYDLCFVGADKGRLTELLELQNNLEKLGLRTRFYITASDTKWKSKVYRYQPRIPYEGVLEEISRSIAIVDFVQPGQVGLSQRPMEALFFEKKLLTNDRRIMVKDFYCRENVFIIGHDNMEDLLNFLNGPYRKMPNEIKNRYDFESWVRTIAHDVGVFGDAF